MTGYSLKDHKTVAPKISTKLETKIKMKEMYLVVLT